MRTPKTKTKTKKRANTNTKTKTKKKTKKKTKWDSIMGSQFALLLDLWKKTQVF